MGTRSITRVNTTNGDKYLNMYRQFDGYPTGHGSELFKFLNGMKIINGISDQKAGKAANGAGCLAAQMIAAFKEEIGGIYIKPVEWTDCWQDYEYIVTVKEVDSLPGNINVKVVGYKKEILFDGTVEDFGKFCETDGGEDE